MGSLPTRIDFLRVFFISDLTQFEGKMIMGTTICFKGRDVKLTQKTQKWVFQEIQKIKLMTVWSFDPLGQEINIILYLFFQTLNKEARMSKGTQVNRQQAVYLRSEETGWCVLLQGHNRQEVLCIIPHNIKPNRNSREHQNGNDNFFTLIHLLLNSKF